MIAGRRRSSSTVSLLPILLTASLVFHCRASAPRTAGFVMTMTSTTPPSSHRTLDVKRLADHANSYAAAHGLQVEKRTAGKDGGSTYQCAPISLLPNAYPAAMFRRAKSLAAPFNQLVDRISRDGEWLERTLGGVVGADTYTGKLLALYNEIYRGVGPRGESWGTFAKSADRLGVQRSDYMLNSNGDEREYELKQVELNTIASSFAGLAVNVAGLHRHLASRFQKELSEFLEANRHAVMGDGHISDEEDEGGVPPNPALDCIPNAMSVAHEQYRKRFASSSPVILFVVQEGETNTVDQRMLEFKLWENHGIPVVRMSLTRAQTMLKLDDFSGALFIKGEDDDSASRREVSVVYFRAGYAPTDYPGGDDGAEWQARETIERSRATKCPCLGYHLAGTKKVQQELARPGTLERFFAEPDEKPVVDAMRRSFAGLFSLGKDATDDDIGAVQDALSGQEGRFVLKPQREGGGYNYYGEELARKLKENVAGSTSEGIKLSNDLAEFILMERLFPPQQRAVLLRAGLIEGTGDSISELGCFGTVVATDEGTILHNEYAGFLLRTKFSNVDEGGVASGFATLSSPYLC